MKNKDSYLLQPELLSWIDEREREHPILKNDRQLALAAGISPSVLSKARSGEQEIGMKACLAIAHAFNVPAWILLAKAGYIDHPEGDLDEKAAELVHIFMQLPEDAQRRLVEIAKIDAHVTKK